MTIDLFMPALDTDPPLPERIPCVSLWEPYASLVIAGVKTIETRTWPWPYGRSWLVIHRAKHVDWASVRRLAVRIGTAGITIAGMQTGGGTLGGLVCVTGDRLLEVADEEAACFFAPNRRAWLLEQARRFPKPLPMRGPQKIQFIPRETVLRCLGAA